MLAGFGRLLVIVMLAGGGTLLSVSPAAGIGIGLIAGGAVLLMEAAVARGTSRQILSGSLGLLIGLSLALLASNVLAPANTTSGAALRLGLAVSLGWLGLATFVRRSDAFSLAHLRTDWETRAEAPVSAGAPKILDTSVIIDGRIAEIVEAGFMEGPLVIPHFVLVELQQVADSSDPLKRNRGRRGLDMLQRIQKNPLAAIQIVDTDFPEVKEVDLKLIELALKNSGKIVTNDFNLNKVAQLRGVKILNINDLANCLRPLVLPGEPMRIFVSKEGKEHGQGVGYLDDGTMVVVEGGRKALGRTIDVNVTTVLQTAAGKMIFVRWPEAAADDLSRKDIRPVLRRTDARNSGEINAASFRDTEEIPLGSRRTAEVLSTAASGGSSRGE
jgi:uncharacterized protein YacL